MAQPAGKRSTMCLYMRRDDPDCQRVRIVLAEKGITAEMFDISSAKYPSNFLESNPYASVPTIFDRDLVLYKTSIITEYLEERFPHPPLLPPLPILRAKSRQMIYRIERDWYPLLQQMENALKNDKATDLGKVKSAQEALENSLNLLAPIFENKTYFISDEFSLVDCCLAPLLWRLRFLGDQKNKPFELEQPIRLYEDRVFTRPSFKATLNEVEFGVKT